MDFLREHIPFVIVGRQERARKDHFRRLRFHETVRARTQLEYAGSVVNALAPDCPPYRRQ